MKNYILLDAISGIDSDIIAEHIKFKERTAARSSRLLRVLPIAAALAILTALALAVLPALLPDDPVPPIITDAPTDAPIVTETPETSIWENPDIVWGGSNSLITYEAVEWNGLTVSQELLNLFEDNPGAVFAIGFWKRPDADFRYNGKSIDEIFTDFQNTAETEAALRILSSYDEDFPSDPELYKSAVEEFGEELVLKYVVDGVFLKEKASEDVVAIPQAALEYYYEALGAYNKSESAELRGRLGAAGINYMEIELGLSQGTVIAFMTEKELAEFDFSGLAYLEGMTIAPGRNYTKINRNM